MLYAYTYILACGVYLPVASDEESAQQRGIICFEVPVAALPPTTIIRLHRQASSH